MNGHRAVTAIGTDKLKRVGHLANKRLVHQAVGEQINVSFLGIQEDGELLERVALAYELAAIEGIDRPSRPKWGH